MADKVFRQKIKNYEDFNIYLGSKGMQGKFEYFLLNMKLSEVYNGFKFYLDGPKERPDYEEIPTANRKSKIRKLRDASKDTDLQRIRNPIKVGEIKEYLETNPDSWIFSSLTASSNTEILYEEFIDNPRFGRILIPKGANLLINDGQHRADAIGQLWNENSSKKFGEQTISVVIFNGTSLNRMQQMFIDLQKGTQVNKSLQSELSHELDHALVREIRDQIPFLNNYIVRDETSVGKGSKKLFTQKLFYDANKYVFGEKLTKSNFQTYKKSLVHFWELLAENMTDWEPFTLNGGLETDEFRKSNLSHLSASLHAFGMVAARLHHTNRSLDRIKRIRNIDFSRENKKLFKLYTVEGKLVNNKVVRQKVRDFLWTDVLGYSANIEIEE